MCRLLYAQGLSMVRCFGMMSLAERPLQAFFSADMRHNALRSPELHDPLAQGASSIMSHRVRRLSDPFGYRLHVRLPEAVKGVYMTCYTTWSRLYPVWSVLSRRHRVLLRALRATKTAQSCIILSRRRAIRQRAVLSVPDGAIWTHAVIV